MYAPHITHKRKCPLGKGTHVLATDATCVSIYRMKMQCRLNICNFIHALNVTIFG